MPGSNSRPNVSEGYEVPLSYRGDGPKVQHNSRTPKTGRIFGTDYILLLCMCSEQLLASRPFLSIPQSGRKNVETFRWDPRLQRQNLSNGSNIGSTTVSCRREAHRYTVHVHYFHAGTSDKTKQRQKRP